MSDNSELNLKSELWGCFKYINIPFDTLMIMPTRDRKFYIQMHNGIMEKEASKTHKNRTNANLNSYAKLEQSNIQNAKDKG